MPNDVQKRTASKVAVAKTAKVEKSNLADVMGSLGWLEKEKLIIDESYQRNIHSERSKTEQTPQGHRRRRTQGFSRGIPGSDEEERTKSMGDGDSGESQREKRPQARIERTRRTERYFWINQSVPLYPKKG